MHIKSMVHNSWLPKKRVPPLPLFSTVKLWINVDKKGVGLHFGLFCSENKSGHPVDDGQFRVPAGIARLG
jgi:hypothetical protein